MSRKRKVHIFETHEETCKHCGYYFLVAYYDASPNVYAQCSNCGWQYIIAPIENGGMMSIIKSLGFAEKIDRDVEQFKHDALYQNLLTRLISEFDPVHLKYLNEMDKEPLIDGPPESYWIWKQGEIVAWYCGKQKKEIPIVDTFPRSTEKSFDKAFFQLLKFRAITREPLKRARAPHFYYLYDDGKKREIRLVEGTEIYSGEFTHDDMLAEDWILCDNWLPLVEKEKANE